MSLTRYDLPIVFDRAELGLHYYIGGSVDPFLPSESHMLVGGSVVGVFIFNVGPYGSGGPFAFRKGLGSLSVAVQDWVIPIYGITNTIPLYCMMLDYTNCETTAISTPVGLGG